MKTSVILFVAGLVVVKSAGTTTNPPTNNLTFVVPPYGKAEGIISVNCSEIHHEITTEQTFGGMICSDSVLQVYAGRKNSVKVATAFFEGVLPNEAYMTTMDDYWPPDCPLRPKELNFYVEVSVTFTAQYTQPTTLGPQNMGTHTLRIGQGHYGGAIGGNNWWIEGVEGCRPQEGDERDNCGIICTNKEGQKITFRANDDADNAEVGVYFPTFSPQHFNPTPAPTPEPTTRTPTTRAPTTRAPTRNSDPDCLRTHPGVERKNPDPKVAAEMCHAHAAWLTANYNIVGRVFPGENTTYEDAGVDGTACTVFNYLSTTERDYWCNCRCPADE
jgi:hypothetical protein